MTCVQTQPCVSPQQDTMAGFDPQKLTRTKATARYIVFIFLFVFCVALSGKTRTCCVELCFLLYSIRASIPHIRASTILRAGSAELHVCQSRCRI
jgi:hypothetical protein